jgi:hypothetical protein
MLDMRQEPPRLLWYNNCAEWFYDIQVLAANQPGWEEEVGGILQEVG